MGNGSHSKSDGARLDDMEEKFENFRLEHWELGKDVSVIRNTLQSYDRKLEKFETKFDTLEGYARKLIGAVILSAVGLLVSGLGALLWLGFKQAVKQP